MSGIGDKFINLKKQLEIERARNEAIKKGLNEKDNKPVNDKNSNEGTTTRTTVDITEMMQEVSDEVRHGEKETVVNSINENGQVVNSDNKYADNVNYNNSEVKIYEFLEYMTEGKDFSENEMAELLINFVQEILLNPKYGSANISAVTQIIDIRLNKLPSVLSLELVSLAQTAINTLLNQDVSVASAATYGDIKGIVNGMIDAIIAKRPPVEPDPVEPDPVEPPVNPDPDPVDPLEELFNQYSILNSSFMVPYIDTIKDEFCLGEEETIKICGKLNALISAMVDEIGTENIDFETAKQIIYDAMHGRWPLKSEVAEVIKNTPNGASLNDAEIMEIVNSLSADIYKACNKVYVNQTGDKAPLTAQEKLDAITQVLQTKRPDLYGLQEPEPDPIVIDTPEKALEVLQAKFAEYNNAHYTFPAVYSDKISDFLLGFQEDASLYLQLKGYDKDFSNFLVVVLAKAVQDMNTPENGSSYVKPLAVIEAKFIEFLQNIESILPTSDNLMSNDSQNNEVQITGVEAADNEYGYQLVSTEGNIKDNDITYNSDGSLNQGLLLKFMLDYFKDTIYGGQLNESQCEYLFKVLFDKLDNRPDGKLSLDKDSDKYDINGNGTYFDDIFAKMMEVTNKYQPINLDEITDEDVNINSLFGSKTSITASDINKGIYYLLNNNPTIRLVWGELINASNKYNVTPNANSLDFYNVFIKMINEAVGVESGNPPVLEKTTLQKYLNEHSIQDLRAFINSTKLRNAYYDSTFKIDGEIGGVHQGKTQDSWLLSGLMILNSCPEGKEIIKNAIRSYVGADGKTYYSVIFYAGYSEPMGPGQVQTIVQKEPYTYSFSQDELYELMATGMYSKLHQSEEGGPCDWESLLFEAAAARLRREQIVHNSYKNHAEDNIGDIDLYGGTPSELLTYLTGTLYVHTINSDIEDDGFGPNMYNILVGKGMVNENDGTIQNGVLYFKSDNHSYAVTRVTADRLYFIDPNDSTKEYYITWSSFNSSSVSYYDSETDKYVKTLHSVKSRYIWDLDKTPAVQSPVDPTVIPPELEPLVEPIVESTVEPDYIAVNNIEEYLSQYKAEAIQYIQSEFGYDEGFADLLVMFVANATKEAFKSKTKIDSIEAYAKFNDLLHNIGSFLPTSNTLMSNVVKGNQNIEVRITRVEAANNEYGYQFRCDEACISENNNIGYNADGSMNQGMLLKFMLDYFKDTIYGGQLNESQLQLLYSKLFDKIDGVNDGRLYLNKDSNKYDKDGDGSYFNDIFAKMMEIANTYQPINIDEIKDEDVNLDSIFGTKASVSASYINGKEKSYLLNNDPTIRLIMGELINASNKYNITPNADSLDFYNVFIKMVNDAVGVESGNPPVLTKEALNAYIERYSVQGLKDLIQGNALRNAYYESTFKINGEIEGFYQADSGDCWVLSGIIALNSTPEGKEIIKNAIKYNPETGKYSVTFYGGFESAGFGTHTRWCQEVNTIEFTKEELFDLMGTGMYSKLYQSGDGTCDWDLFLFEVAVSKLIKEQGGKFAENKADTAESEGNTGDPYIYGGTQYELIGYLTGMFAGAQGYDKPYEDYRGIQTKINELIEQGLIDEDGTIHNYAFYFSTEGHAYAITKVKDGKVYFINPGDSTKEYYIKLEDLGKSGVTYYDAKTDKKGQLAIAMTGFAGPLDETPAYNS